MYIANNIGDNVLPWRTPDSVVNHSPLPMFVLTLVLLVLYVLLPLFVRQPVPCIPPSPSTVLSGHSVEGFFKIQKSYEKGLLVFPVLLNN